MNERIRELAKQAAIPNNILITTFSGKTIEKFAELIIRECGKISNEYLGRRIGDIDLNMVYKEHFGIDE